MCLMSPFVIVALRSSQSFIVGLGTVYVGIRHRLAPAFVFCHRFDCRRLFDHVLVGLPPPDGDSHW